MKRHPGKHELFAYAESLVDRRSALSAKTGGHLASCPACKTEVEGIRRSLTFLREAPELQPSNELTRRILLAAQSERRAMQARARGPLPFRVLKAVAYAAAILVVSAVCFSAALNTSARAPEGYAAVATQPASPSLSPEAIRKATTEIQTLASAVNAPSKKAPNPWELERRRAVHALNDDLEAAKAALERNPGCQRASRLVDTNLQRQAQTLRDLYVDRSL